MQKLTINGQKSTKLQFWCTSVFKQCYWLVV